VKRQDSVAFQKQIGARVRQLRRAKGISQEAFADACGLHRTHMSLLERGRVNVTVNTLHQITAMLGIRLKDFFSEMK
jgi:transcriptional regulator with XRE-family HTH domain